MASLLRALGLNPGIINNIDSISLNFTYNLATFILAMIILLPATWFLCRFEGKPINKQTKRKILTIRIIWSILLSLLVAGPILVITGMVPEKSKIAVLIDTSKSMSIKNKISNNNEISRLDDIKSLIQSGFLTKIEEKTSVKPDVFTFSDSISQTSIQELNSLSFEAEGNQTNLNGAIKNTIGNLGGSSLLGVIILTDGSYTIGGNLLSEATNIKTPLHFVMPDNENNKADISISLYNPPSTAYLNSGIRVKGEISVFGNVPNPLKIEVTCDNQPYNTIISNIKDGERKSEFTLNIPCNKEGNFKYEFTIPEIQNELTNDNNKASFLLKVVKERLNILAISGNPSWELKFMGNAAMSDPNAHFTYICKLFDNKWAKSVDMKPTQSTTNPGLLNKINESDVIIINGVEYNDLKPVESAIINKIETGEAGLLILSSNKTFAQLGYTGTELAKILPVNIESEKIISNIGNYIFPSGNTEYSFLKIIDDTYQNNNFFSSLPKPEEISNFGELKIGAENLLGVSINGKSENLPFIIKNRYGRGNILTITGGPLWYSGFKLVQTDKGFTPYSAMIVNMFKMLANRHEDAQVSLELPTNKNVIGIPSSIKIWVTDSKHQLLANAQTALYVINSKKEKISIPCVETSEKGCYEATFVPTEKGIWQIEAEASYRGRLVGKTSGEILIEPSTAEFDNPEVNIELMKKVSEITGGKCVFVKDANKLIESLTNVTGQKLATKAIDMRDSWLFLIIMLLMPAIEWYIRRTGGLS